MNRRAVTERDLREVPAYSIAGAAGYLRVPPADGQRVRLGHDGRG